MSISGKKTQNINTSWSSSSDGGETTHYWGGIDSTFDLTLRINDAFTEMALDVTCTKLVFHNPDPPLQDYTSYGCLFVAALEVPRSMNLPYLFKNTTQTPNISWDTVPGDIAEAMYNKPWSQVKNRFIFGCGVGTGSMNDFRNEGLTQGSSTTITRKLTDDDFDSNGNYKSQYLLFSANMFRNYGANTLTGPDINGKEIDRGDRVTSINGYKLTLDDFDYYPGDIMKSGDWMSHNRYYSSNNSGGAFIRSGSNWRDIKNSINPRTTKNKGFIRSGSDWKVQDLIGIDKDTGFNR